MSLEHVGRSTRSRVALGESVLFFDEAGGHKLPARFFGEMSLLLFRPDAVIAVRVLALDERPAIAEVEVGIDRVYSLIQRGRLMVFDDLDELHDELTTYSRELDDNGNATDKIEDKASYHLLDALRYIGGELAESGKKALSARTVEFYA